MCVQRKAISNHHNIVHLPDVVEISMGNILLAGGLPEFIKKYM